MAVRERTRDQLQEQSRHLLYEIQMLFALGHDLRAGELDAAVAALPRAGLPIRNAVIEAFEIHARQLIEFLTHQRNATRATAREWARGWAVSAEDVQELKQLREAFSERVAHLSWKRSEFTASQQLVLTQEIEDKLRPLILRCAREADDTALCQGFVHEAYLAWAPAPRGSPPSRSGNSATDHRLAFRRSARRRARLRRLSATPPRSPAAVLTDLPSSFAPVGFAWEMLKDKGINRLRIAGAEEVLGAGGALIDATGRQSLSGTPLLLAAQATPPSTPSRP